MRLRLVPRAVGLVLAAACAASAQEPVTLSGRVVDATTSTPVIGAIVTATTAAGARNTRTDETGTFAFPGLATGEVRLLVRRVGYDPHLQTLMIDRSQAVAVTLRRVATLDTVRVRAARQAIYGVVADATTLSPLPGAAVQVFGSSVGATVSDSTGHFFHPIQSPGPYLVRAKVSGRGTQSVSVSVERGEGVEIALLMDSTPPAYSNMLEMGYGDMRERMIRRGLGSALVPRSELMAHGEGSVTTSLLTARSFTTHGLLFTDEACVFVDGVPRPGLSAHSIDVSRVESVEVYSASGDRSGTLRDRWPRNAPCGDTGMPRRGSARVAGPGASRQPSSTIVRWIVIWLRH